VRLRLLLVFGRAILGLVVGLVLDVFLLLLAFATVVPVKRGPAPPTSGEVIAETFLAVCLVVCPLLSAAVCACTTPKVTREDPAFPQDSSAEG
jgi:hypothetical protein